MSNSTAVSKQVNNHGIPATKPSLWKKLGNIHLLLLTVTIFWGTSYVAAKIGMHELLPLNLAIVRFVIAAVLFGLILLVKKGSSRLDTKDLPQFCFLGFFAITLYFHIQYTGLLYTTSTNAGLIMATAPAFAALFCLFTKKEAITKCSLLGIGIAFLGVLLVITQGQISGLFQQRTFLGDSLILLNALMWAWFTLKSKTVLDKYNPFVAMAYVHIFGAIFLLPFAFVPSIFAEKTLWQQLPAIGATTLLAAVYLAVFCSVYSYFVWYVGIAKIGAVKTATYSYFNPLMATLAGVVVYGDMLTIYTGLGGLLAIAGVYITNQKKADRSPGCR